jgi:hypothetical protein
LLLVWLKVDFDGCWGRVNLPHHLEVKEVRSREDVTNRPDIKTRGETTRAQLHDTSSKAGNAHFGESVKIVVCALPYSEARILVFALRSHRNTGDTLAPVV